MSKLFAALDAFFGGIRGFFVGMRGWVNGPLANVIANVIIVLTGVVIVIGDAWRKLDRWVAYIERAGVAIALFLMTLLAFNEYLQRELKPLLGTSLGGLWDLEGQMNLALLLMVVVGFFGASLATRDGKHIAVDAIDRALSPAPARFVRRFTNLVAAGLCWIFANGAWDAVFSYSRDAFEGVKVWGWMVAPVNFMVSMIPGEKFGPSTAFASEMDWEDAQYDLGNDPFDIPAFGFVEIGDKFPLWIPVFLLVVAFLFMSLRFLATALNPPVAAVVAGAPIATPAPGTRRPIDVVLAGALPGALVMMGIGAYLGQGYLITLSGLFMIILGAPLFVGVGVATLAAWQLMRDVSTESVINDMFEATKKQELLAIPFFVLAGNLMTTGAIAERLIDVARATLGRLPGGLGVGAVLSCAFFAAISGSSPVTVIAIGTIMFPMLIKEGYSERYSMGVLSTAGSLGIIIPPSIPMIVYAIMVSRVLPADAVINPSLLFKAGILPGIFIASVLAVYTFYLNWPRPGEVRVLEEVEGGYFGNLARTVVRGAPSLALPVLILGGIYGWLSLEWLGIPFSIKFTVNEAAAVAVVYALFVEMVINRELEWKKLPGVFWDSAVMMGSLFLILVIAISLNRFFVFEQIPDRATAWMMATVDSKIMFLLVVNLFLLGLGCVMDILSAILIVAPLLAPIAHEYGIHPVHFGIMFIVNLELGYLTPPLGINLFVASTVFERPILDVIRSVLPFLLLMLFCLIVIVWVPGLSLWLIE